MIIGTWTDKVVPDSEFWALAELLSLDPSARGVAGLRPAGAKPAPAALRNSAARLLETDGDIAIITGFYVPGADPPAAETDGPPGALALARALRALGKSVVLLTDRYSAPLLRVGIQDTAAESAEVIAIPWSGESLERDTLVAEDWIEEFLRYRGPSLGALVSIERNGPSHTVESASHSAEEMALFVSEVPFEHHDHRHNMRGEIIDRFTPPLDKLFDRVRTLFPRCFTLGIGDGGNEIGMGCFTWRELRDGIRRGPSALIPCRVATDEVITAGISNWGACALVVAMALLEPRLPLAETLSVEGERTLLMRLVRETGAVDGVTRRREPSVDGVPAEQYLAHLGEILNCALHEAPTWPG